MFEGGVVRRPEGSPCSVVVRGRLQRTFARLASRALLCGVALVLLLAAAPAAADDPFDCGCGGEDEIACDPFQACFFETTDLGCDSGLQKETETCGCLVSTPKYKTCGCILEVFGECLIPELCKTGESCTLPKLCTYCRNQDRHQSVVADFRDTWTWWALRNQRERLGQDEPINRVMSIWTHNGNNNRVDALINDNNGLNPPQHEFALSDQLDAGARWLGLDVHNLDISGLTLCHGREGGALHFGCSDFDRLFVYGLKEIRDWMLANPEEVVVIALEDELAPTLAGDIDCSAYTPLLEDYLGEWILRKSEKPDGHWPSMNQLRAMGRRIILFGFDGASDACDSPYIFRKFGGSKPSDDTLLDLFTNGDPLDCPAPVGTHGECDGNSDCWSRQQEDRNPNLAVRLLVAEGLIGTETRRDLLIRANDTLDIRDLAGCNVAVIGLDWFLGTDYNKFNNIPPAGRAKDTRIKRAVWSWKEGQGHDAPDTGVTVAAMDASDPFGRWDAVGSGGAGAAHFACARPRRPGGAAGWLDPEGEDWKITVATGSFAEGHKLCEAEYPGYEFSVPRNGYMNRKLLGAAKSRSAGAGARIYLAYAKADGDWNVVGPPGVPLSELAKAFEVLGDTPYVEGESLRIGLSTKFFNPSTWLGWSRVEWVWGDGRKTTRDYSASNCDVWNPLFQVCYGAVSPPHTYEDGGAYPVTVIRYVDTLLFGYEEIGRDSFRLSVQDRPPLLTAGVPAVAPLTASMLAAPAAAASELATLFTRPSFPSVGETVELVHEFRPTGSADRHQATVEWGDGSPPEVVVPNEDGSSGLVSAFHRYDACGTHLVQLTLRDDDGLADTRTDTVQVFDRVDISCPADVTLECTSPGGTLGAIGAATASSGCGNPIAVQSDAPSLFPDTASPVGATAVQWLAQRSDLPAGVPLGNGDPSAASCSQVVVVTDTVAPSIGCPAAQTLECTGEQSASASLQASATDACWGTLATTCTPGSGSRFPLGDTSVSCDTTDGAGLSASCQTAVTVVDTLAPSLTCPAPQVVECTGALQAPIAFQAAASDTCWGTVAAGCDRASGSAFPLGDTTLACSATDGSGLRSDCAVSMRVVDTQPPVIESVTAGPDLLWPPNGEMRTVQVEIAASDVCDPAVQRSCRVVGIASSEADPGNEDARILGPGTVSLRAERSGGGPGRVYTVTVECVDAAGRSTRGTVDVTVPHDQR